MLTTPARATPAWTWRRCLLWCLPALIVGAILRISFLAAIPEAYYGSDSSSYFNATVKLYSKGKFDIESKRRWLYPLLLMAAPPLPGSVPQTVAVVQHLVGLATIFGIGWVASQVAIFPGPAAAIASLLAAIWPRMLWYEHEVVAECWMLAAFVGTLAMAFPLARLGERRRLLWFLLAAAAIVAFKPHGRPLWLGLVALAVVWNFWKMRWPHLAAIGLAILLMLSSGSDRQGSWLLLSSTLPLVQTSGEKWSAYRAALKPVVESVRGDLHTYPYIQQRYKKPLKRTRPTAEFGPVWAALNTREEEFSAVAKGLAFEGIRAEPVNFVRLVTRRIGYSLADATSADDFPISHFWDQQERRNAEHQRENPRQLSLLYEAAPAGFEKMTEERRTRALWFEPWLAGAGEAATWMRLLDRPRQDAPEPVGKWTGWLALGGALVLAVRRKWRELALLSLPAAFYLFVVYAVGDRVARYLHPVDWLGLLLIVLALDGAAALTLRFRSART